MSSISGLNWTFFLHEITQLGCGDGHRTDTRALSLNQNGWNGIDLDDKTTIVNGRSRKTHASKRVESSQLKTRLISESYGISNSWVMEVVLP